MIEEYHQRLLNAGVNQNTVSNQDKILDCTWKDQSQKHFEEMQNML